MKQTHASRRGWQKAQYSYLILCIDFIYNVLSIIYKNEYDQQPNASNILRPHQIAKIYETYL